MLVLVCIIKNKQICYLQCLFIWAHCFFCRSLKYTICVFRFCKNIYYTWDFCKVLFGFL